MKRKQSLLVRIGVPAVLLAIAVGVGLFVWTRADAAKTERTDRAFLQSMVPHHESAIEMATVAKEKATIPELKKMADDIVVAQGPEIEQIKRIYQRLFNEPLIPDMNAYEKMGLTAQEAGMQMDMDMNAFRNAQPFDKTFIDEMTAHHQGAIRMAQQVLKSTKDEEIKELANAIITAQEREVAQMKDLRNQYFPGSPSSSSSTENNGH